MGKRIQADTSKPDPRGCVEGCCYLVGPETPLYPLALYRGSGTIAVYFWKLNGAKFAVDYKWKI